RGPADGHAQRRRRPGPDPPPAARGHVALRARRPAEPPLRPRRHVGRGERHARRARRGRARLRRGRCRARGLRLQGAQAGGGVRRRDGRPRCRRVHRRRGGERPRHARRGAGGPRLPGDRARPRGERRRRPGGERSGQPRGRAGARDRRGGHDRGAGRRGRAPRGRYAELSTLGIDLGGTKILAAVVSEGRVLDRVRVDTPQTGFADVVAAMAGAARELISRGHEVTAVGVGSPGPLDHERGRVVWAPNIAGMVDAPVVDALREELGLPVALEDDANAAGYAEHLYGAAKGLRSSVYVTLSTGIGGGLFVGETLVRGAHGLAGEIGHITLLPGGPMGGDGHTGSLEAIAAGRSIARDASYAYGQP